MIIINFETLCVYTQTYGVNLLQRFLKIQYNNNNSRNYMEPIGITIVL